jgi:hypothetical protein
MEKVHVWNVPPVAELAAAAPDFLEAMDAGLSGRAGNAPAVARWSDCWIKKLAAATSAKNAKSG